MKNPSSRRPTKAPVARSNTRVRFIFLLKSKSKLSSVLWESRNAACLRPKLNFVVDHIDLMVSPICRVVAYFRTGVRAVTDRTMYVSNN